MDIYSPAYLNRVVQDLKSTRRAPFLLDRYFRETSISTNGDTIFFDVLSGKPRLSPFVSPVVEGMVVESMGYATKSFSPAYVKDKRVLEDGKAVRRPAGAPIGGPLDAMAVRQLQLAQESDDQIAMIERRQEWMAAQELLTGAVTVSGEKYPTTSVDFGRDAGLSPTLLTTARWNDSGPDPLANLETWAGLVRDASGANAVDVIMSSTAWTSFRSNTAVRALLNRQTNLSPKTGFDVGPESQQLGVAFKGQVGDFSIWVYTASYTDDAGATQKFLPNDYLLMVGEVEGVRHYGQIKDEAAGFRATDYFQKSWTQPDPAVRYLMLQSAPLPVPYRINATLAAKVQ